MTKRSVLLLVCSTLFACVSQPSPWSPEWGDHNDDARRESMDGTAESRPADVLPSDATPADSRFPELSDELSRQDLPVETMDEVVAEVSGDGVEIVDDLACQPDCDGKACGDDGCGGSCGTCDDEEPCNGEESCNAGTCVAGDAVDCSAVSQCMKAECNPFTGACDLPLENGSACDDGSACTVVDYCAGGECVPGNPVECDEPTDCASFQCNAETGECDQANAADGKLCQDGEGQCLAGQCVITCGDDVCEPQETCSSCSADCGECPCDLQNCPDVEGYKKDCNTKAHCEYRRVAQTEDWHLWDVWIYVPAGNFQMGSENEGGGAAELPVHSVNLDYGYLAMKYEATVLQYEACMASAPDTCTSPSAVDWDGYGWGVNSSAMNRADHPQNGLNWTQASGFCNWVASGGRLPSEAEWEYMATGPEHTTYAWGNGPSPTCSNDTAVFHEAGGPDGYGCGTKGTWPVGSKESGASFIGAMDVAGNVWEWTEDWYHPSYTNAPADGSPWLVPVTTTRVGRGGGFSGQLDAMRLARRFEAEPGARYATYGVRCVRPPN